jgi:ATP-binding cassette subfamily B protein
MIIRVGVRSPVMLVVAMIFAFRIHAGLSLIFLAIVPILAFGLVFIFRKVHPIFVRVFKTYDKLNNTVQENLHGIRVVKSYTREGYEIDKFEEVSQAIFADFTKAEKRIAFNAPLMQLSVYTCFILLAWFGAREIVASGNNPDLGLSTGELTSLFTYTMQILMSLMMLSMIMVITVISRASAERIAALKTEESALKNGENPIHEVADGSIAFEDVSFSYSDKTEKPVLNKVNIRIESGETVGIIGGTG